MKLKNTRYPIVRLPSKTQISIFLIKEELKSRRLFQILEQIGLNESHFRSHMETLIMQDIGIDCEKDENYSIYNDIMEKRCRKIEDDNDSITKQALKAYYELVEMKKRLA